MSPAKRSNSCAKSLKPRCYCKSKIEFLGRSLVKKLQTFDHNQIFEFIESRKHNRSMKKCKLYCENDGIRIKTSGTLSSSPIRKFYSYKDIECYYVFENNPSILALGCVDREKQSNYYDCFRILNQNMKNIIELIDLARNQCDFILQDKVIANSKSANLLPNNIQLENKMNNEHNNGNLNNASIYNIKNFNEEISKSMFLQSNNDYGNCVEQDILNQSVPELNKTKDFANEMKEPVRLRQRKLNNFEFMPTYHSEPALFRIDDSVETNLFKIKTDPHLAKLCENIDLTTLIGLDAVYVDQAKQISSKISGDGPMYMFIARHKTASQMENEDNTMTGEIENKINSTFVMSYF